MTVADVERESRRIRRQALAMDMLQTLRPALLHELKGPMQAILSAVHMLKRARDAAPTADTRAAQDQYVDLIKNSVQQLIAIGEAILPGAVSGGGNREPVELAGLTRRVLRLLRDLAALDGVAFELDAGSATNAGLQANKEDLQLALTALLVGILNRSGPDSTVMISITQPDGFLRWSALVPAHPSRLNPEPALFAGAGGGDEPGTDLAWSTAREIVVEHGGRMTLEDAGRDGWTLELALPAARGTT